MRECCVDIRTQDWADPPCWEATIKYLQCERAKEEIAFLNVEIRRLHTFIHDEEQYMLKTLDRLTQSNHPLEPELQKQWSLCSSINAVHKWHLDYIYLLPYFSETHGPGLRQGGTPPAAPGPEQPMASNILADIDLAGGQDTGVDDDSDVLEEACDVLCSIME